MAEVTVQLDTFESEDHWQAALGSGRKELIRGIRDFASDHSPIRLVAVLKPFLQLGVDTYVRPPKAADRQTAQKEGQTYAAFSDRIIETLVVNPADREKLALPAHVGEDEFKQLVRAHFTAAAQYEKQMQGARVTSADQMRFATLTAAHIARLGDLVFARVPRTLESQAVAYRQFYVKASSTVLSNLASMAAVEQQTPALSADAIKIKPRDAEVVRARTLRPGTAATEALVGRVSLYSTTLVNRDAVALFPESIVSPGSSPGARVENKGGEPGEGVRKRFESFFLQPLDSAHPLLVETSNEKIADAQRIVAKRKALAEVFGLSLLDTDVIGDALASALSTDKTSLSQAFVELQAVSVANVGGQKRSLTPQTRQILEGMVEGIAGYEIECNANNLRAFRFLGVAEALNQTVQETRSTEALKFMNLLTEVFRDQTARQLLGLESLL